MRLAAMMAIFFTALASSGAVSGWSSGTSPEVKPVKLLWQEDFSGGINSLEIELRNGAAGEVSVVDSPVTSGRKALKIVKRNQAGYILVTPAKTFTAPVGTALQSVVHTHGVNANPAYAVGFMRLFGAEEDLSYFKKLDGRGPGGPKMQYIINSPAGTLERKLAHFKVSKKSGTQITPAIVVAGTPSESYWENWFVEEFTAAKAGFSRRITASGNKFAAGVPVADAEFSRQLAQDIQHTAEVRKGRYGSELLIDGKVVPPVFFIPWAGKPGRESVNSLNMQQHGVNMHCVIIRFGGNSKRPGFWSEKGFDIPGAVKKVRDAMRCAPGSNFILTLTVNPYDKFADAFPDEVWKMADGRTVFGHSTHIPNPLPAKMDASRHHPWISIHSDVWRSQVKQHISALVAALQREGLDKRVIGIHFTGFHDNQFGTRQMDFSAPAARGFRTFLQQKYGTVANLQKAWKRCDIGSFEALTPPQFGRKQFFDPEKDPDKIDWFTFQKTGAIRLQDQLAAHVKKCFGKKIIVIRYCMAAFGPTLNDAYDIGEFLNSKNVDVSISQPAYGRRTPGVAIGVPQALASFHHHGKLFINDFDLRTYASVSGNETELRMLGLSCALNDAMWQSILRKMAGQMIASGMGYRYLDMANGWFSPPGIVSEIGKVTEDHRTVAVSAGKSVAQTAMVVDEKSMMLRNFPASYYNYGERYHFGFQIQSLAASGVPMDIWLLDDMLDAPELAQKYKVVIFAGLNRIDAPRKKLLDFLKKDRRTLIFLNGSGRLKGGAETGFTVKHHRAPADHEVIPAPGECNMLSALHSETVLAHSIDKVPVKNLRPERFSIVENPQLTVHARYKVDGLPAIASRDFGSYRTVYVGNPGGLTPEFFNRLTRQAGGFVAAESGLQIDMNDKFISVHCVIPGRYCIRLPRVAEVVDLKDGKVISSGAGSFVLDAEAQTTYWFALK